MNWEIRYQLWEEECEAIRELEDQGYLDKNASADLINAAWDRLALEVL